MRTPPLWVFAAALLLAGGVLYALHWLHDRPQDDTTAAFVAAQQQRLAAYLPLAAERGQPRIIGIGNSLMRLGTPLDTLPGPQAWQWLRITNPYGFIELLPSLAAGRPDVLLIQTDLLLPPARQRTELFDGARMAVLRREALREYFAADPQERHAHLVRYFTVSQRGMHCPPPAEPEAVARAFLAHTVPAYWLPPQEANPGIIRQIRAAAPQVGRIVLLDIPRAPLTERLGDEARQVWHARLREAFADLPNVSLVRLGEPMPRRCYCDLRHLAPACRDTAAAHLQHIVDEALRP